MERYENEDDWEPDDPQLTESEEIDRLDEFLLRCVRENRMPAIHTVFPGFTSRGLFELWQRQHGNVPEWLQTFVDLEDSAESHHTTAATLGSEMKS